MSCLSGGVRRPARLCHSPGAEGALVAGVVTRQEEAETSQSPQETPGPSLEEPSRGGGQRDEEGSFLKTIFSRPNLLAFFSRRVDAAPLPAGYAMLHYAWISPLAWWEMATRAVLGM